MLAQVSMGVRVQEDGLVIALQRDPLIVAELEGGVEGFDEGVGGAAADCCNRNGDGQLQVVSEAAMGGDRGSMDLAGDEEDGRPVADANMRERLGAAAAFGAALKV